MKQRTRNQNTTIRQGLISSFVKKRVLKNLGAYIGSELKINIYPVSLNQKLAVRFRDQGDF